MRTLVMLVAACAAALAVPPGVPAARAAAGPPQPPAGAALAPAVPLRQLVEAIDIPSTQFRLNNGLRVVVHTDRKAPLVHVGVWYHVGSRDEPLGRSGFAHLFEHIMFRGSKHSRQDHFRTLEDVGATDFNGTTSFERTNYFQTVPTPALELALFLESDRMGWLLPALSQEVLDQERAIVINEKRQGENAPGGLVRAALLRGLFPPSHPFSVSAIGLVPDLEAATLDDARDWFRSHYGPNNAVLVLAGDIDATTARPIVERWFGQIPPGPVPARPAVWVPDRPQTTRETLADQVAQPRLVRAWAVPGRGTPGLGSLDVGLAILGNGPTSLLHEALVRDRRLLVSVSAGLQTFEGVGMATISAEVRPGVDPAEAEAAIDAVLDAFRATGPEPDAVARVAMRTAAATIRGLERIGGFGGKGAVLAEGLLLEGDPAAWKRELAEIADASPESVRAAVARWLGPGDHRITLLPGPRAPAEIAVAQEVRPLASRARPAPGRFRPQGAPFDRTAGPPPGGPATRLVAPAIEHARLANGLAVRFARNTAVPVTRVQLSFPVGVAGDSADRPGTQRMLLALLPEGSAGRLGPLDGPEIARAAERLGAAVGASAGLDSTRVSLSVLTPNLAPALALFADLVRAPAFPPDQLERVRGQVLASLAAEAVNPSGIAMRAAPGLMFGPAHPYGRSFSGSGTPEGVRAVTRADLVRFHAEELRPAEATLLVVSDLEPAAVLPLLERALGDWSGPAPRPAPPAAPPAAPQAPGRVILFDRPDAPQSLILAGAPLPLTGRDDTLPLSLANDLFGGMATARLNRLLREEKNWTYGAFSRVTVAARNMPFLISAPVETGRTADSIAAIRGLLAELHGARPAEADELERARQAFIRSLPGDLETGGAFLGAMERAVVLARPDDWLETLPGRAEAVTLAEVRAAPLPRPDELVFIVVGDRKAIEPQLRSLGLPLEVRNPAPTPAAGEAPRLPAPR